MVRDGVLLRALEGTRKEEIWDSLLQISAELSNKRLDLFHVFLKDRSNTPGYGWLGQFKKEFPRVLLQWNGLTPNMSGS